MSSHQFQKTSNGDLDILTHVEAGLQVTIRRAGAEMISLRRRDARGGWVGFLHRDGETGAPVSGWANHATVMGFYVHRLWQEQSLYRGTVIKGGTHGFLRHFHFAAPEVGENSLTYRVAAAEIPPDAYPLRVSLALTYTLSQDGVRVDFSFVNEEPERAAHLSFGLHPGFQVTSPATCRLLMPAGTYERQMAPGNFLDGTVQELTLTGGDMTFDREKLPDSYILGLGQLKDRIFVLEDEPLNRRIRLDFSEAPYLTIWSDMNPYLCVEPCWGLPDSNPPRPFEEKAGIQRIAPGATLRAGFSINPGFLS